MKKIYVCCFLFVCLVACKTSPVSKNAVDSSELIFQSGFEPGSKVVDRSSDADIIGADETLADHNNWVNDLDNHPEIGNFNLQYQGGDSSMRVARIIAEPSKPTNHVLQFWLNEPNVEGSKGRIQANLYNNNGFKEFYQSVRVFLTDDFLTVRTYPKQIHWLTIAEFWNNITWSQNTPFGFRITLGAGKATEKEDDLHFILDAQDCELFADGKQKYTTIWAETNPSVHIPIGKWFQMEYYYKEGDQQNGRFYLAITPEGESKQVIFDVRNITHNTHDPKPDGVTDFNPLKLYTSKELIEYMKANDKTLQIYWDDFKLWKNKRP